MCKVDKCCFMLELQLGAIIIGFVDLVLSLATGLGNSIGLHVGGASKYDSGDTFNLIWEILFIVHVIACVLLIVGAFMEKQIFIIPWLITTLIKLVLIAVGLVLMIIDHIYVGPLIWSIIFILITVYFWVCVYSYYSTV